MADLNLQVLHGRPQCGRGIMVGGRFPPKDLERLDAFASGGVNRSEALGRLVEDGLKQILSSARTGGQGT